ncbi:MAG: ribonuclease HII [Desulfovibrio sp.]|nr:ribonuclease HII [Desulfovibrio sp.]
MCGAFPSDAGPYIGIDEAGRGCLAGPVVAAAMLFPPCFDFPGELPGLDDSKRLRPAKRRELASLAVRKTVAHGVGFSWQDEIDEVNILNATFRAMSRAVLALAGRLEKAGAPRPAVLPPLVIDGNRIIPYGQWQICACGQEARRLAWEQYFPVPLSGFPDVAPELPGQRAVVGGDALDPAVSAASVLAKTVRDGIMMRLDEFYSGYGFARHKGYGTKEHLRALAEKGPCTLHRKTFQGVKPRGKAGVILKLS